MDGRWWRKVGRKDGGDRKEEKGRKRKKEGRRIENEESR